MPEYVSVTPVCDEQHAFKGSFGMVSDITKRKKAEEALHEKTVALETEIAERQKAHEELAELNRELEQRVKQRNAELADKNKELERFNKLFVNRELKMIELKERIKELEKATN
jgi:hypothetical protein